MSDPTNPETIRKRNSKKNETIEQREARLKRERELKRQKRASETDERHEARLTSVRERRSQKTSSETTEERERRLNRENERKRTARARNLQSRTGEQSRNETRQVGAEQNPINELNIQERALRDNDNSVRRNSATTISEDEHRLLQNFRKKMDNIRYKLCNVCNERTPSMTLINEMC